MLRFKSNGHFLAQLNCLRPWRKLVYIRQKTVDLYSVETDIQSCLRKGVFWNKLLPTGVPKCLHHFLSAFSFGLQYLSRLNRTTFGRTLVHLNWRTFVWWPSSETTLQLLWRRKSSWRVCRTTQCHWIDHGLKHSQATLIPFTYGSFTLLLDFENRFFSLPNLAQLELECKLEFLKPAQYVNGNLSENRLSDIQLRVSTWLSRSDHSKSVKNLCIITLSELSLL